MLIYGRLIKDYDVGLTEPPLLRKNLPRCLTFTGCCRVQIVGSADMPHAWLMPPACERAKRNWMNVHHCLSQHTQKREKDLKNFCWFVKNWRISEQEV
jgi:hypothetical protein